MPQANARTETAALTKLALWPLDAVVGLLVWAAALVLFQLITLNKFSTLPPGAGFLVPAEFYREIQMSVRLGWQDAVLFLALVLIALYLLWRQLKAGSIGRLLVLALSTERRACVLLALSSLLCVRYYFARGQMPWGGDAGEHIAYCLVASRSFAMGEWPIWTNSFAGGSPYLQFYGFLFFYCVGLVDQIIGDIHTSLKVVMGSAHVLSGLALYGLARLQRLERPAALLAALAYVLCVWHVQQVLFMGRFPLALFYALLPLPFLFFERSRLRYRQLPSILCGGLSLAGLAFTHPGYAYWATFFYGIYAAVRSGVWKGRRHLQWALNALAIAVLGLILGAYLTLPMYLEREFTGLWDGISLASVPDPGWQHLLVWSNFRIRLLALPTAELYHWYGGYMGLSLVALAFLAIAGWAKLRLVRARACAFIPVLLLLLLSLVLVMAYRNSWVQALPMVTALSAGRYLLFVTFFLALAAGWGGQYFCAVKRSRYGVILLILAVDLGTTTFQHPYLPRSEIPVVYPKELTDEIAGTVHADGRLPAYRIFATTAKTPHFVTVSWLFAQTSIPTFQSLYTEAPRAQEWMVQPWARFVNEIIDSSCDANELKKHRDYSLLFDGARMQNVRHVIGICDGETPDKGRALLFGWPNNTPVLASSSIAPFPAKELELLKSSGELADMVAEYFPEREGEAEMATVFPALWTIRATGVHPTQNSCETIYLRDPNAVAQTLDGEPQATVSVHEVWNERVRLQLRVNAACFVRLAYAYYPFIEVNVDGRMVEAWQTAGGSIAIKLEAGEHVIELIPRLSSWRRGLLLLDGILLLGGGWWCFRDRRRKRLAA
ncbi:MAG: hypothetical protein ACI906_001269 [Candidatus Latescibacterota bacterium]|jgi:hypothetical protein